MATEQPARPPNRLERERGEVRLKQLEHELAERTREALLWHQRAIQFEEALESKDNELKGVLKAKGDTHQMALEELITYHELYGTIDNAIKHLTGPRWPINKWLAVTILGLAFFGFFYAKPELGQQLGFFVQTNQPLVIVALIIIVVIVVYAYKGKRK